TTDGVKVSDFLEKAPVDKTDLQEQVNAAIFAMENPSIQRIVRAIVKKYQEDLFVYPAASKNHHAFVSGLAYHVVTMLKLADSLSDIYYRLTKDLLLSDIFYLYID